MNRVFLRGTHKGKTFDDLCIEQPLFFIELMKKPVCEVIDYLDFIQYCMKKLQTPASSEETESDIEDDEVPSSDSESDEEEIQRIQLNFDGCSKGNPGKAGAGCVIYDNSGNEIWSCSKYIGDDKTNNYAEYYSLIIGLRKLNKMDLKHTNVVIYGDSELIIRQMNGTSKVKSKMMKQLNTLASKLIKTIKCNSIVFEHVLRKFNQRADQLANESLLKS